jgi:tyrosyl-tRNA synthetase
MKNEKTIIKELKERHVFVDMTGDNGLEELLKKEEKLVVYCGFDPTADSLHVGSLLPLVNMKRFIDHGHKVIALVGGATGLIGDPSFKDSERGLNSIEKVEEFKAGIRKQIVSI